MYGLIALSYCVLPIAVDAGINVGSSQGGSGEQNERWSRLGGLVPRYNLVC